MGGLTGRTVLITGAARGIGAASARRLAGEGARLVLADLDGSGVNALAAELGQVAIRADVTRAEDIERMVDEPYQRWGRLDVLYDDASIIRVQPMLEVTRRESEPGDGCESAGRVLHAAGGRRAGCRTRT